MTATGAWLETHDPGERKFIKIGSLLLENGETLPDVWRLQFVGEPILWPRVKTSPAAHARIDRWSEAQLWISNALLAGVGAPIIEKENI